MAPLERYSAAKMSATGRYFAARWLTMAELPAMLLWCSPEALSAYSVNLTMNAAASPVMASLTCPACTRLRSCRFSGR